VQDAPEEYIEKMLNAIVGIEISIAKIEAKWKVSQNQPLENQLSLVNHLKNSDHATATCMAEEISKKIKS
jgi:transcriptional regulator